MTVKWGIVSTAHINRLFLAGARESPDVEILAVASGKKTKSEINGVGEEEFAPWSIGPTL